MTNVHELIQKLKLETHPEGGYFKELYRSVETINKDALPERYSGDRCFSTSIYYLLRGNQKSTLHRLKSDEIWHFYLGSQLRLYMIDSSGIFESVVLGQNIFDGETPQFVIPKGIWFGAHPMSTDGNDFSLVGCTVAPGFDFKDFEMGNKEDLLKEFPHHKEVIEFLC